MASLNDKDLKNYPLPGMGDKASASLTEVTVLAAPGGNKRHRVTGLYLSMITGGLGADRVIFRNGISGATFFAVYIGPTNASPTYSERNLVNGDGLFVLGANQALMASVGNGNTGVSVHIAASSLIEEVI